MSGSTFVRSAGSIALSAALLLPVNAQASDTALGLTLSPWMGPELPGSIAETIKYRLELRATPGKTVVLSASHLPKAWIAAFCTDNVCAPFRVATLMPRSGTKIIEFQLIPDGPAIGEAASVRVEAREGRATVAATAVVESR